MPLAWRPVKQQKHLSLSFAIETKNYNSRVNCQTLNVIFLLVQELFSYQKRAR